MPPPSGASRKPELPASGVLDWTDARHWSGTARPCRYCQAATHLRDSHRKPAHKTCAEHAIAQYIAESAAAYENERLV